MSKIKLALISFAIITAIGGAFATRPQTPCELQTQYYQYMGTYLPAGQYGEDYICETAAGICTYYRQNPFDPNSYVPCRTGAFTWVY